MCKGLITSRFCITGAHYGYGLYRCQFTSTHDVVYLEQIYINKVLLGQYNSTSGQCVGYTEKAKEIADDLNRSQHFLKLQKENEAKCRTYVALALNLPTDTGDLTVKTLIMPTCEKLRG